MNSSIEPKLSVCVEAGASGADTAWVNQRLADHAAATIGKNDFIPLTIFLRDTQKQLQGGLLAWTLWSWMHIDTLWVEPAHRRNGNGKALLLAAERAARIRGCKVVDLETFNLEACQFYQGAGYHLIGSMADPAGRFSRYYLSKVIG